MTTFRTRFAPSPTGRLHLGHAFSAMVAFRTAAARDGDCLLRIEDIDQTRCKTEFELGIFEDLKWLGLRWNEPVRRQSDHFGDYQRALTQLIDEGLVYRCFRTRKEVAAEISRAPHFSADGPDGPPFLGAPLGAAEERAKLEANAPFAWRLSLSAVRDKLGPDYDDLSFEEETANTAISRVARKRTRQRATPAIFGDVVLGRKDSGTSYHLASVLDDATQKITDVIRGEDLRPAAHLHVLLQALFDLPAPIYHHHPLIRNAAGKRLAKRDQAQTLRAMRENGLEPAQILALMPISDLGTP